MAQQTHTGEPTPNRVQQFLAGLDYPANKEDLIEKARKNQAPDDVLQLLEKLPSRQFEGPSGVMKAYGDLVH